MVTTSKFLRDKGVIPEDRSDLIITKEDGTRFSLSELLQDFMVANGISYGVPRMENPPPPPTGFKNRPRTEPEDFARKSIYNRD